MANPFGDMAILGRAGTLRIYPAQRCVTPTCPNLASIGTAFRAQAFGNSRLIVVYPLCQACVNAMARDYADAEDGAGGSSDD